MLTDMRHLTMQSSHSPFGPSTTRFWICVLMMCALMVSVMMRSNLSMSIVCMVKNDEPSGSNQSIAVVTNRRCALSSDEHEEVQGYDGDLTWSKSEQSMLFSATYYSAIVTTSFSGYLADRFGPKLLLLIATIDLITVTLLTSQLARMSYSVFFAARVFMGLGEGFVFPCLASLAGRWFAADERATVGAIFSSGNQLAVVLTSLLASNICASSLGWETGFYVTGVCGVVWCLLWSTIVSDDPQTNKYVGTNEKEFLQKKVQQGTRCPPVPWKKLVTSLPIIAGVLCQWSFTLHISAMEAFMPTYLKEVLELPVRQNGMFTMILYITQLVAKNVFGVWADYIKRQEKISNTMCCKLFQIIGGLGSSISLLAFAFIPGCGSTYLALTFLVLYGIFFSTGMSGFYTGLMSVAPMYSGLLGSISMLLGTAGSMTGPAIIGILSSLEIPHKWEILFGFLAAAYTATSVFFWIFGSADVQDWVQMKPQTMEEEERY